MFLIEEEEDITIAIIIFFFLLQKGWQWHCLLLSSTNFILFCVCVRCKLKQERGMVEQISKFQLKIAWEVKDI
jgi:hypothetical protein